ncbi:outer membrane protein OmpA-like peptidoglycan-associated protein [Moheibacter stercoris]|uniref:Outer membrane protein OmpA-like peptidoglycan-associated protein n=2 Tax=Moheibacter stercoris TaxID=1628251 RepID=A0ABV2LTA4_9FLAO
MLKKWYISGGVHAVNHPSVRGFGEGLTDGDNWSFVPPLSQISVARTLNRSFAVDLQASVGEIDNKRLMIDNEYMVLVGLGLRYRFANGYILKETSWFDPYLRLGANYHRMPYRGLEFNPVVYGDDGSGNQVPVSGVIDVWGDALENGAVAQNDHFAISGGLGMNFWIWPKIGINLEAQYVAVPAIKSDYIDFFQAKAGLAFRFGKNDRDKDGIVDEEDECPDTWGLAEFNGCPDTDGDKIPDHLDKCPEEACPNGEETDEYYCEEGCKKMKEKPVDPIEPIEPIEVIKEISFNDVLFEFDSSVLTGDSTEKVKEAAAIIQSQSGNYFVDGFADSDGSEAYNLNLSRKRAQAVKDALVKEGVDANRLEVRAFGEQYPKCTNETPEGRACNRRVVVLERY